MRKELFVYQLTELHSCVESCLRTRETRSYSVRFLGRPKIRRRNCVIFLPWFSSAAVKGSRDRDKMFSSSVWYKCFTSTDFIEYKRIELRSCCEFPEFNLWGVFEWYVFSGLEGYCWKSVVIVLWRAAGTVNKYVPSIKNSSQTVKMNFIKYQAISNIRVHNSAPCVDRSSFFSRGRQIRIIARCSRQGVKYR